MTLLSMRWSHILFTHWTAGAAEIEPRIPGGVELDLWRGKAVISLVGLRVAGPGPGPLKHLLRYRQVNVRTYVTGRAGPGIFLLDSWVDNRVAAAGGRLSAQPYRYDPELDVLAEDGSLRLVAPGTDLVGSFDAGAEPHETRPGTLTWFCLDRFHLYARSLLGSFAVRVKHEPWKIREVDLSGREAPSFRALADVAGPVTIVGAQMAEPLDVAISGLEPAAAVGVAREAGAET
jgi:uncharacterized protein YqjF (DUF2071 family)